MFDPIIEQLSNMFGTIVVYESTFSIVNFVKSYYSSSISKENLVFELRYNIDNFYIDYMLE